MYNYKMTFADKLKYWFGYSKLAEWCIPSNWKYLLSERRSKKNDYK